MLYNFLHQVGQQLQSRLVFAGVFPYLEKEHLLLADMIVLGYKHLEVVDLSKGQDGGRESVIIVNL